MAALLANPAVLAGLGAAAIPVGEALGGLAGKGIGALGNLLGLKKGGAVGKSAATALNRATVKRTGIRKLHRGDLVIPKRLAKKLKAVAKRRPQPVKKRKVKKAGRKKRK